VIRAMAIASAIGCAAWGIGVHPSAPRTIAIAQFTFSPKELHVARGDTVVWENADILLHTTTADSAAWSSGELAPRARFRFVASDTGRFAYHCASHPTMRGLLVVR
jgi:plastocyanin